MIEFCKKCGEIHLGINEFDRCYQFEFNIPDYDDEWASVYAKTASKAAERACELFDIDNEYNILSSGSVSCIKIIKIGSSEIKEYFVEAENRPVYRSMLKN